MRPGAAAADRGTATGFGRRRRRGLTALGLGLALLAVYFAAADRRVARAAEGRVFADTAHVPVADMALVLGTGRTFHGRANFFYEARLDAAAAIYRAGRVRGILVSGDNSRRDYSEPADMKADLVLRGVPAELITCDFAGFRTLDSVQRCHRVFGQQHVTIVSQRFHLERALFLARADGLDANGFVAAEAPLGWWLRARLREVVARGVAVVDATTRRGPRFLGAREPVALGPIQNPPPSCRASP